MGAHQCQRAGVEQLLRDVAHTAKALSPIYFSLFWFVWEVLVCGGLVFLIIINFFTYVLFPLIRTFQIWVALI